MKRIAGYLVLLVFAGLVFSCARALAPAEQAYLNQVNQMPLKFTISTDKIVDAWSRANGFVANYSSMRITMANEYTIQTFAPLPSRMSSGINYGYYITRVKNGDTWEFNINCVVNNMFAGGRAIKNAKILAWYIYTGELPFPELINK